jgi:DNA-binding protein
MVGGNRLMKGVNIPKVKFMSKDIETPQNETSPKQTVFAPVKRYF